MQDWNQQLQNYHEKHFPKLLHVFIHPLNHRVPDFPGMVKILMMPSRWDFPAQAWTNFVPRQNHRYGGCRQEWHVTVQNLALQNVPVLELLTAIKQCVCGCMVHHLTLSFRSMTFAAAFTADSGKTTTDSSSQTTLSPNDGSMPDNGCLFNRTGGGISGSSSAFEEWTFDKISAPEL